MPKRKTSAGLKAEARRFVFVEMEEYATRADGQPRTRRLYRVPCIDCGRPFNTPGGISEGKNPKEFAYRLNWRCERCRSPESVERGRRRFEALQESRRKAQQDRLAKMAKDTAEWTRTQNAKRRARQAEALGVDDLI